MIAGLRCILLLLLFLSLSQGVVVSPTLLGSKEGEQQQNSGAVDDRFFSAARVGDLEVLRQFLSSPKFGDVSQRDAKGNSALIIASGRGQTEAIRLLLKSGANPEEATAEGLFEGKTALCWAASQGRVEAVALLLQAGANAHNPMEIGIFAGKTPLMWASSQGRTDVVRLLLSAGVVVDFASQSGNFKGKNALMWGASQGRVETVALLLERGSNVNAVDNDGISALMWASGSEAADDDGHKKGLLEKATKGHIDVVSLLLKYGASPDMRDKDGITAIMYACYHGHAGAVEALLNAGADADFKNKAGRNALQLALNAGFTDAAATVLAGPTFSTLPIQSLLQTSTCGWLLSVVRAPLGTGIYASRDARRGLGGKSTLGENCSEGSEFPSEECFLNRPQHSHFSLASSCDTLAMNGLDHNIEDLLLIVKDSSVEEVVEHMGLPHFAAKVRATSQLKQFSRKYQAFQQETRVNHKLPRDTETSSLSSAETTAPGVKA